MQTLAEPVSAPAAPRRRKRKPRKSPVAKTETEDSRRIKHRKEITKCEHVTEQYYASGMCKNCYHSKGRNKMAERCEHKDRKLYARGVCKACYLRDYHSRIRKAANASEEENTLGGSCDVPVGVASQ